MKRTGLGRTLPRSNRSRPATGTRAQARVKDYHANIGSYPPTANPNACRAKRQGSRVLRWPHDPRMQQPGLFRAWRVTACQRPSTYGARGPPGRRPARRYVHDMSNAVANGGAGQSPRAGFPTGNLSLVGNQHPGASLGRDFWCQTGTLCQSPPPPSHFSSHFPFPPVDRLWSYTGFPLPSGPCQVQVSEASKRTAERVARKPVLPICHYRVPKIRVKREEVPSG